jgi:hypothetical protein
MASTGSSPDLSPERTQTLEGLVCPDRARRDPVATATFRRTAKLLRFAYPVKNAIRAFAELSRG